jgi:hypothetical protein
LVSHAKGIAKRVCGIVGVLEQGVQDIFGLKRDEGTGGWRKLHHE